MNRNMMWALAALGVGGYLFWFKEKEGRWPWESAPAAVKYLPYNPSGPGSYKGMPSWQKHSVKQSPASSIVKING